MYSAGKCVGISGLLGNTKMNKSTSAALLAALLVLGLFSGLARAGEKAGGAVAGKLGFAKGKLIRKVVTRHDPGQSYALYLPRKYDPARKWPILYGFSPGARGVNPVYLFQAAAEKYGWIVVGSNNSRNGPWKPIAAAIDAILKDTEARLSIDKRRRYTTGFSGGARVGFHVALEKKFAGTIPVGAGLPNGRRKFKFGKLKIFSICGTRDFNHAELLRLERRLNSKGVRNRMATFEGTHGWPGRKLCGAALRYMELLWQVDHGKKKEKLIRAMLDRETIDAEKLLKTKGQFMRGHSRLKELCRLFPNALLKKRLAEVEADKTYAKEKALSEQVRKLHKTLEAIKDGNQRFTQLVKLYTEFIARNKGSEAAANLAVMLQATARQMAMGGAILMRRKDYRRAEVYLHRARIFSPRDSNLAYNLACALARNGKKDAAIKMLATSVKLGFKDMSHIKKDPDLASLRSDARYRKIVGLAVVGSSNAGEAPATPEKARDEDQALPLL
jgi:predicted esterase